MIKTNLIEFSKKNSYLSLLVKMGLILGLWEVFAISFNDEFQKPGIFSSPEYELPLKFTLLAILSLLVLWFSEQGRSKELEVENLELTQATSLNAEIVQAISEHALVVIANLEGRITYINDFACEFFGYARDEVIGESYQLINSGVHGKDYLDNIGKIISNGKIWNGQLCNRRKDGSFLWVNAVIAPLIDVNGKHYRYIAICWEITEAKKQATQLKIFAQAIDYSADAIIITDKMGAIQYVNPATYAFTGWHKEQLLGRQSSVLNSTETDPEMLLKMNYQLSKGQPWHGRLLKSRNVMSNISNENSEYWADVTISSFFDENKNIAGYIEIQRDISAQIEYESMLKAAHKEAKETTKLKSEFLNNMSHEIRNPLNGLMGMLSILMDSELSPDQADMVQTAYHSSQALLALINDILVYSKLENSTNVREAVAFNLPKLIEEVCTLHFASAYAKRLEVNYSVSEDLSPCWRGDAERIRQVLSYLVSNAIKFTESGSINVKVSFHKGETDISQLYFEVADTGVGIDHKDLEYLFLDFDSDDNSLAHGVGVRGLGLCFCKKMVELMSGEIGARSLAGQGTCFWFRVPLEAADESTNLVPAISNSAETLESRKASITGANVNSRPNYSQKRILIVENDQFNQKLLITILAKFQITPAIAANGREALDLLNSAAYDLVLMDCQMPEMDGYEATRVFRQQEMLQNRMPRTPIVALTANATAEARNECYLAGMDDYLSKPFDQNRITEILSDWLE